MPHTDNRWYNMKAKKKKIINKKNKQRITRKCLLIKMNKNNC